MIVAVLNESPDDSRVAISPQIVKHYIKLGLDVSCEAKAGLAAGFCDEDYINAGAEIVSDRKELLSKTNVLLAVNAPSVETLAQLPSHAILICSIDKDPDEPVVQFALKHPLSLISMNLIPRISRAQSMDTLSSQANLAGYRAVIEGVSHFNRAVPMMMTAAGMIQAAKILILGAGVAGLQAIATAKRLGAIVYAFDVRLAAKEQVESLGAEFIAVNESENNESKSGYAREMSEEYQKLQAELIHKHAQLADIIITTALIPGKKAPILIKKETVAAMKAGSVIVDLATSRGGNCELSEYDKIIQYQGVTLIGYSNMAGFVPATASELYSQNLLNLMRLIVPNPESIDFNPSDEIIKAALLCHEGRYLPFEKNEETLS